jgi:hypothetical protein
MDKATTLTSLAMLKVNADVANRDYVDYVVPFVSYVLTRFKPSPITAIAVQGLLKTEFGLAIPQHPTEFVLHRMVKRKILRHENYVYVLATDTFPIAAIDSKRDIARRQQDELLSDLREFAQSTAGIAWTPEESRDALLAYLSNFSIECLRTYKHGTALPSVDGASDRTLWILNSFIKHAHDTSSAAFSKIITLVKGHMLANALMCSDLSSIPRHFGGVAFYLDTPLVLRALDLEGEPRRLAAVEVFELITRLKGQLSVFEHTREEIHGVIRGAEAHFDDPGARGKIVEEARRAGKTRSDLTLLAGRLDDRLRALGIVTRKTPPHVATFEIDEKVLGDVIGDEVHYYNKRALEYDIDSIRSIYTLREGSSPRILEDAAAVLVTSNSSLARAAFEYGRKFEATREVSSVIADFSLANLAWLKAPLAAPELPRLEVMAACHAALEPADALWSKYLQEIDRLENQGGISSKDHEVLRYSLKAREELMNLTGGTADEFSARTVSDILDRVKADLVAEQMVLLASKTREHELAKAEWEDKEARLRTELGQTVEGLETQRALAFETRRRLDQRLQRLANALARTLGWGLVMVLAFAVAWHAAAEWLRHSLGRAAPWAAAITSALITLGALLLVVHGVVGMSARDIVSKAEDRLKRCFERLLRLYVFGDLEGERRTSRGPTDL